MKKFCAAGLALFLLLGLCACGSQSEIRVLEEALEPQQAVEETTLDWEAAYAAHAPEDVVFTVGTEAVTWQELFYQLAYCTAALESSSGVSVTDWNMEMTGEDGELLAVGDYVMQTAVSLLKQYHVIHEQLTARGVSLSEEGYARAEAYRQTIIKESFAGDEAAFQSYLDSLFCTVEMWDWICQIDELYNEGFAFLYGDEGGALSEEEALAYGEEYGYVGIRQLYIYNNSDPTGDSAEPSDTDPMSLMLAELAAVKDDPAALTACFDELYAQYNENLSLANYPEGRCVWSGDVDEAVYEAALAMEDYEYAIVSLTDADVLLLRQPLTPEADVFYDAEEELMYSLRYYAAWQAYTDQIYGSGGWLETAVSQTVQPFENFSLEDVF